jgi:hypothetical protein
LSKRFDSKVLAPQYFLSSEEQGFRLREQDELKTRGVTQRVITNEIKVEGDNVSVDSDRILSSVSIRSAVSFPLVLSLSQTDRTQENPYGLLLSRVTQPKSKEAK